MRLSFRCVVRNGIRRFQIADPTNDPERLRRRRADGAGGGRRGDRHRPDLLDQRGAHARVLRRARGGARRLRGHGPAVPEGSRRAADGRRGARAGPALPRRGRRPRRSSCTATARSGSRRSSTWRGCAPGSRCCTRRSSRSRAGRRTPRPRRRSATSRPRASRTSSTRRRSRRCRSTSAGSAVEKGLPIGQPQEFDATYYHHQLAGGMVSTTQRMLAEQRRPELFDAVLEEVGRVRAEMGYPIIVTPVSQLVATQAVRNVIDGERWSNVSDEIDPLLPRPLRRARRAWSTRGRRPRPLAPARRGAARTSSRSTSRAPARRFGNADLRRGAAAPADDARGAGGRDGRAGPGRRRAARSTTAPARGGDARVGARTCVSARTTGSWSGTVTS